MNATADLQRRGVFLSLVVNGAKTEKNLFLTVPIETAKAMPVRVQKLLGHRAHAGITVVHVTSRIALLQ